MGPLWLAQVLLNLVWRYRNVTVLGWDRPADLVRSLEYFRMPQLFSWRERTSGPKPPAEARAGQVRNFTGPCVSHGVSERIFSERGSE